MNNRPKAAEIREEMTTGAMSDEDAYLIVTTLEWMKLQEPNGLMWRNFEAIMIMRLKAYGVDRSTDQTIRLFAKSAPIEEAV